MSYKVISTVLSDDVRHRTIVDAAVALATRFDAHLDVAALGINYNDPGYYTVGTATAVLPPIPDEAIAELEAETEWVNHRLGAESVRWSLNRSITQLASLPLLLARGQRFCDLIVLSRPYQPSSGDDDTSIAEACLFDAERPVLMLPKDVAAPQPGGRILLAWNEGAEALAAARAALPFLQAADQVDICMVDPPRHGPDRSDPGGALAQYLVRHGVKSQIMILARTEESIAAILNRKAQEIGAEMLVTGAYGHSRLREAIFGGTSRELLETCTLPMLMAR